VLVVVGRAAHRQTCQSEEVQRASKGREVLRLVVESYNGLM